MDFKLFAAAKAFVIHNNKVLILRESNKYGDASNIGKFDVPGGRVNPGENFNEGLLREIKEEIGLNVDLENSFFVNEWRPVVKGENWHIVATFFKCNANSNEVKLSEDHDEFLWIDPKDYKNYNIIDNLKLAFEAYLKNEKIKNFNDKKHIVAITAFIKNNDKFLIVKRNKNEIAYPSKWAFPGGKVEKGQNIIETLKREVFEEVGLEIDNYKKYLKDYTFVRPDGHNVVGFCFLVNALNLDVKLSNDFEDYKWITPDELKDYDYIEGMEEEVYLAFND